MLTAKEFALKVHEGQMYGDVPYWHHLQDVVSILASFGYTGKWEDAGWLHDTPEEPGVDEETIEELFGEWMRSVVHACYGVGRTRIHRNSVIYSRLFKNPEAVPVKTADRIAHIEHAEYGSKFAALYWKERIDFDTHVAQFARPEMRERLEQAYKRIMPRKAKPLMV